MKDAGACGFNQARSPGAVAWSAAVTGAALTSQPAPHPAGGRRPGRQRRRRSRSSSPFRPLSSSGQPGDGSIIQPQKKRVLTPW